MLRWRRVVGDGEGKLQLVHSTLRNKAAKGGRPELLGPIESCRVGYRLNLLMPAIKKPVATKIRLHGSGTGLVRIAE